MTIPHLMNCSHSEEGWCLDCVKLQHDQVECLQHQISELTLRLNETAALRDAYKAGFLRNPSFNQIQHIMSDLGVMGSSVYEGWANMDQPTQQLFLNDVISLAKD